jgi:hypothetical protein
MRHLALASLVVLFGCSSGGEGSPVGDSGTSDGASDAPAVTPDQACTELAAAFCEKANSCAPVFVQLEYGDVATCNSRFKPTCLGGLSAPGTSATPANVSACATAAKAATCSALFDNNSPSECLPKPGTLDDGKPCTGDNQCKSAFCALDDSKAVCGVACGRWQVHNQRLSGSLQVL